MQSKSFSRLWIFFPPWTVFLALALAAACVGAHAQDLKSFEQRITVKVLPNGLTLILCERHEAPVFSYTTFIDAGDVNDPSGESGLAHMFEHLAFKGTTEIGTKDYAAEKVALEKVEAANDAYEAEYLKPIGRSEEKLKALHQAFLDAQTEAEKNHGANQSTEVAEEEVSGSAGRRNRPRRHAILLVDAGKSPRALGMDSVRRRLADACRRLSRRRRGHRGEAHAHDCDPVGRLVEQYLATASWPATGGAALTHAAEKSARSTPPKPWPCAKVFRRQLGDVVVAIVGDVDTQNRPCPCWRKPSRMPAARREEMTTVSPKRGAGRSRSSSPSSRSPYCGAIARPAIAILTMRCPAP